MLGRLRLRFILTTMISVFIVLGIIMTTVNLLNFRRVRENADGILDALAESDGSFDEDAPSDGGNPTSTYEIIASSLASSDRYGEELRQEIRYFSVLFIEDTAYARMEHITAVSASQAIEMAKQAVSSGNERGYDGDFRYLITSDKSLAIFLDCSTQLRLANNFLIMSLLVSLIGLQAVFLLVLLLADKIIKPIVDSHERQKRFITDAGHELKTPLSIISANNELTELTSGETESTQAIAKQVARLTAMVKNLTALARMNEDEERTFAAFEFSTAAEETVKQFQPIFDRKNISFSAQIMPELVYTGDETLIRQLFSVIFDNAAKYCRSECRLSVEKHGKKITISLSNDAEGIEKGKLDRCFERFYRTDHARASEVEGSGIGLSLAKEIVAVHKGSISAYAETDENFTVKIIL